jgi:hypothetical protein
VSAGMHCPLHLLLMARHVVCAAALPVVCCVCLLLCTYIFKSLICVHFESMCHCAAVCMSYAIICDHHMCGACHLPNAIEWRTAYAYV